VIVLKYYVHYNPAALILYCHGGVTAGFVAPSWLEAANLFHLKAQFGSSSDRVFGT